MLFCIHAKLAWSFSKTKQGFESMMGVNHYAVILLNYELLPLLTKTENFRLINTSSIAQNRKTFGVAYMYKFPKMEVDEEKGFIGFATYAKSKISMTIFTRKLNELLVKKGVKGKAICVAPGVIYSGITRYFPKAMQYGNTIFAALFMRNGFQGAQSNIRCAFEDYEKLEGGEFYNSHGKIPKMDSIVYDEKVGEGVWNRAMENLAEWKLKERTEVFLKTGNFE